MFGFNPAALGNLDPSMLAGASLVPEPPPPAQVAPAAVQAPPPPVAQAPSAEYKPSALDILQGVLFNGQSPADAAMAARQRHYQAQQSVMLMDALEHATPQQRQAILFNAPEYGKAISGNFAPIQTAEGATQTMYGGGTQPGGYSAIAPKLMLGPAGQQIALTQNGSVALGPQLAGKKTAANGVVTDENLGLTGQTFSMPQIMAPGSSGFPFTPTLGGVGSAQQAGQPGSGQGPSAATAGAPRGIRNNNFGNVRALPNGQAWNGQTGVDPQGYAVFASPEDGVRAAQTNLTAYATKHGINTVAGVVNRWAPQQAGNNTSAYTHYVAGALGVDPNQKIDLTDPKTQQAMLSAMFHFENGPEKMAAWRAPQGQGASAQPASQPGGGGFGQPFAQGAKPRVLSPQETTAAGYAPGTVVEQDAAGHFSVSQQPQYDAAWDRGQRDSFQGNTAVTQYTSIVRPSYEALVKNIGQMTGPAAYAILDTAIRTDNPGATTRQAQLDSFEHKFGIGGELMGKLLNFQGKGTIPKDIQQKIIDSAAPFAQSHYDAAKAAYDANAALAKEHNRNVADLTVPIGDRPERYVLGPNGSMPESAVIAEAKAAVAKGASPAAVRARLKTFGISGGL